METSEKLQKVIEYLNDNHVEYAIMGQEISPYVRIITFPRQVAVCVCPPDKESSVFKEARKKNYMPMFIRDNENSMYVIFKLKNALKGWNTRVAKEQEEKARRAKKNKRHHISHKAERVDFNETKIDK